MDTSLDPNIGADVPLSKEYKGEIALKLLKYMLRERGIHLAPQKRRELGNIAKKIGVPLPALVKFARPIFQEMLDEVLAV